MSVAMQFIVDNFDLPFEYVSLVRNESNAADEYLNNNYNIWGVPSCYVDGGMEAAIGAETWDTLMNRIVTAGGREVVSIGMGASLDHIDSTLYGIQIQLEYDVEGPLTPDEISGADIGLVGQEFSYATVTTDADSGQVWYHYNWGDDSNSGWLGPYESGELCTAAHTWSTPGQYDIIAKARDAWFYESDAVYKTIILDEFYHGDANGDMMVNILDVNRLISFLYYEGQMPEPYAAGDCDGNIVVNILDITYLINYLYYQGPPPVYDL